MSDKFSIDIDRRRGMVRIVMTGLLTLDDVGDFYAARQVAHEALGLPKNAHLTLNDVRDLSILPQQTLAAFCDMLADPEYHSRRLAFVVAPTLVKGQVARAIAGRSRARCFTDAAEAEAWLLDEDEAALPLRKVG